MNEGHVLFTMYQVSREVLRDLSRCRMRAAETHAGALERSEFGEFVALWATEVNA